MNRITPMHVQPQLGPEGLPPLATDEVRVLSVPLDRSAAEVSRAAALLIDEELQRARRFLLPDVARRFIVSHAALRAVLGQLTDVSPRELRFDRRAGGKPELGEPVRAVILRFNLSHAGELAVIAVSRGREVGVDIEPLRPLPELARLAPRILSAPELEALEALPPAAQAAALLRGWTRKEALLKAVGCGVRVPLPGLQVGLDSLPAAGSPFPDPLGSGARWRLHDIDPGPGWAASLAVEERDGPTPRVVLAEARFSP